MSRLGFDLSATRCHLVEVRAARRVTRRSRVSDANETRVLAFETIPFGWSEPGPLAASLRKWLSVRRRRTRRASVTVWGLSSAHQFMVLPPAAPAELAALAQREAARDVALLQQTEVVSGIQVGASRGVSTASAKREVVFVAASALEIRSRIQPLIEAGCVIEAVTTPPLALCSIPRLRRGTVPGTPGALLVLGSTMSALAIVRDGLLLFAREMPWGCEGLGGRPVEREQFAAKLAAELRRSFLFFKQSNRAEIGQVTMCGDAPELRALTAPLIMALDLEVETLDSLDGINAAALPEPADLFRDRVAQFRLAWAIAADAELPINLSPPGIAARRPAMPQPITLVASATAAVIVGLIGYAYLYRTTRPIPRPPEISRTAPTPRASPAADSATALRSPDPAAIPAPPRVEAPNPPTPPRNPSAAVAAAPGRVENPGAPVVADPVVRSILYSPERRAALVDHRIVGIGDQLNAGRIVEIERDAIIVETPRGERRRFVLRAALPPGGRAP